MRHAAHWLIIGGLTFVAVPKDTALGLLAPALAASLEEQGGLGIQFVEQLALRPESILRNVRDGRSSRYATAPCKAIQDALITIKP